jgi:hypothetical protein
VLLIVSKEINDRSVCRVFDSDNTKHLEFKVHQLRVGEPFLLTAESVIKIRQSNRYRLTFYILTTIKLAFSKFFKSINIKIAPLLKIGEDNTVGA